MGNPSLFGRLLEGSVVNGSGQISELELESELSRRRTRRDLPTEGSAAGGRKRSDVAEQSIGWGESAKRLSLLKRDGLRVELASFSFSLSSQESGSDVSVIEGPAVSKR